MKRKLRIPMLTVLICLAVVLDSSYAFMGRHGCIRVMCLSVIIAALIFKARQCMYITYLRGVRPKRLFALIAYGFGLGLGAISLVSVVAIMSMK